MAARGPDKTVSFYDETGIELWNRLESRVREKYAAEEAREGEVAAQVFADYLGVQGPLDGGDRP